MELIEQKADHGALDIHYYAEFVISVMAKLCAPARDEIVDNLRQIKEVVPLFRFLLFYLNPKYNLQMQYSETKNVKYV